MATAAWPEPFPHSGTWLDDKRGPGFPLRREGRGWELGRAASRLALRGMGNVGALQPEGIQLPTLTPNTNCAPLALLPIAAGVFE